MRVAHVTVSYVEGLGYEENYLGLFQAALGVDVFIITSTRFPGCWADISDVDHLHDGVELGIRVDRGVKIHRLKSWIHARNGSQIILRRFKNTLKKIKPDILHVHNPVGVLTAQALMAAKALDIPVVVDSHVCGHNMHPYGVLKRLYYHAFGRTILRHYDSIIRAYLPLTRDCEEILNVYLEVPNKRMTHTTLGVDTEAVNFRPAARKRIREHLGIPLDAPVVAFVGRVTPGKEVDVLVTAWSRLAQEHDAYLVLVGPLTDGMEESLSALIDPTLTSMLKITGLVPHPQLPDYLSACDLGVWSAAPGISVIDAMACHVAILYSDAGAIGHLAAYGNGELFARGDVRALVAAINAILRDRSRLEVMRRESRRLAEDVFDWRVVAARTNSVYDAVLQGREPSLPAIWSVDR